MSVAIEIRGLAQFNRALGWLSPESIRAAGTAMYREAERIMADSKQNYVPVDLGTLKTSGFVRRPTVTTRGAEVEFGYGGAAKGYALYVHEGTGPAAGRPPFMPPVDVIARWARRHGIDERHAFVIARAIGRRGLRPLKYLERPVAAARRGMDDRLAADARTLLRGVRWK